MKEASNIRKLYAMRFFQSLVPAYVIERLFWEERGMTVQMVVYTEIIYAVTIVLLEIPTGILADRWSRKGMIVLSAALSCFEFLILVYATAFWHFALVVFLAGIATSAVSGSGNALLYDSLLRCGRSESFEKIVGRMNGLDLVAAMLAALGGSWLAGRFDFELNYWISLAGAVMALGFSLGLVEPAIRSGEDEDGPATLRVGHYLRASLAFFRSKPGVLPVMLSGMVTGAAVGFVDEFWQLYLERLDFPVMYFGLFSAGLMLARLPGNMLAFAAKGRLSYRTLLSVIVAAIAGGFAYLWLADDYSGLAAMLLIFLLSGLIEPLAAGYLHHRVGSSVRATVDSFQSLGTNAVLIVTGLGFGYFSSRYDIFGGFGFLAVVCGAFFVYLARASGKMEEPKKAAGAERRGEGERNGG